MAGAAKRARGAALEAVVTTEAVPGAGLVNGMFVRGDGTRLFSSNKHTLLHHMPAAGMLAVVAGNRMGGFTDGESILAEFNTPTCITVDRAGDIVLADYDNHALRRWPRPAPPSPRSPATASPASGTGLVPPPASTNPVAWC